MGRKFFQRYSRKYFQHITGNSSYCLVGEIFSFLGKIDIFYNLSGKRSKKSKQISVFVESIHSKKIYRYFLHCTVTHLIRSP